MRGRFATTGRIEMRCPIIFGRERTLDDPPPVRSHDLWSWVCVLVVALLLATCQPASAQSHYEPSTRGTRPEVTRWTYLLEQYDWHVPTALRVIDCESEGREWIPNYEDSGALGLFQVMPMHQPLALRLTGSSDLSDPVVNVAVAYALWADNGGSFRWPWDSSVGCWG